MSVVNVFHDKLPLTIIFQSASGDRVAEIVGQTASRNVETFELRWHMLKQKPDTTYIINTENKNPCAYPNTAAQIYHIGERDGKNP